ncbi:MAG: orotate phosphoribosyltransferase [Bryobacteraceae bacterium]
MSLEHDRARLSQILSRYSVRRGGEFKLASGKSSNVYCDARVTTCRAQAMPLIGRLFLNEIATRGWRPHAVGGLTMGADPIVIAVARESLDSAIPMNAFLVRKEPKGHGKGRQIEGLADEETALDVVIVEDTSTTGGSALKAIDAAREAGHRVLGAITLVDREEGAREAVEAAGYPFAAIFRIAEL